MAIKKATRLRNTCCLIVLFVFLHLARSFAGYQGPTEAIQGSWGNSDGAFGIDYGDTSDSFPTSFKVTMSGYICIADRVNRRAKVYSDAGTLLSIIVPQQIELKMEWPGFINCDSVGNTYMSNYDEKLQKYGLDGKLLWTKDLHVGLVDVQGDDTLYIFGYREDIKAAEKYIKLSSSGELLKSYPERPADLGIVERKKIAVGRFKVLVTYPDKVWCIERLVSAPDYSYMRSLNGTLYGIGNKQIVRYNDCGKESAVLVMPGKQYESIESSASSPPDSEPPRPEVLEEYGSPVLAPNGDVYTWKRTPDKYFILKWTWQDDPNAPANAPDAPTDLKVSSSPMSLTLTWKTSLQDPGCVTGYEISRSTTSGGGYSALGTVEKGILKYEDTAVEAGNTYYYKVRAVGVSGYSEYSNEASMAISAKRPQ